MTNVSDLERKIDLITKSLSKPYFNSLLRSLLRTNPVNAKTIYEYIIAEQTELNIKNSTIEGKIKVLVWLSNFHKNKSFAEMTKQDILEYLNNLRKSTVEDPTNKWVGTYNGRQIILLKFFKWLYSPEVDFRNRQTPICMNGVRKLPRKEKTAYKPSDIWEAQDHAIFLKYCPSKRDSCYHALANDMSARPSEILNLKVKDIKFNRTDENIQYAEVRITHGKTGPRSVPLIDSIPFLKEWLEEHPNGTNPEAYVFISQGNNHGSKLTLDGLSSHYDYYKTKYFPKLLENDQLNQKDDNIDILQEYEKALIKNMLTKPWNLYIFRHSALTEKSLILSESVLKDHAGWTMSSKMTQIYIHLSGESTKVLLQKKGILKKGETDQKNVLKSKSCPNCFEPNKQENRYCVKCRMVLSFNTYNQTVEEEKQKVNVEFNKLKECYQRDIQTLKDEMNEQFVQIMKIIRKKPILANIKPEVLEKVHRLC